MAPRSRLSIAKPDIIKAIEAVSRKVWTADELNQLMQDNAEFWRLAKGQSLSGFIQFLEKDPRFKAVLMGFPQRKVIRYVWGRASVFELALSLQRNVYLTHYGAVYLHGLTEQV